MKMSLFAFFFVVSSVLGTAQDWEKILVDSDLGFIPEISSFNIRIENHVSGEMKQFYELQCYMNGKGKYLAFYTGPNIMLGQGTLRNNNVIYYYVKKVDRLSNLPAETNFQQSTLSQEDVMNTMLSNNYRVVRGEMAVFNGNSCYKLELESNKRGAAYSAITAYINAETLLPVKREYYSRSGLLCREMLIQEIQVSPNGEVENVKFVFSDVLAANKNSLVTFSNITRNNSFPSSWFTINYLKLNVR
jgi:outer membrane lipoprotein-sorting protein